MAEIALVSARKGRLSELADEGDVRARLALQLLENPTRFLSTVQIGVTVCSLVAGAYSGATLAAGFGRWLERFAAVAPYAQWLAFGTVIVSLTFLSILFGELLPKRLALHNPERVALALARPMRVVASLAAPVVWFLSTCTDTVARLVGADQQKRAPISDEEISQLIEQGLHAGVFHKAEKAMVEGVMGLDRCPVTALMTPRPKIVWLNLDDPDEVNWRKIVASGHSHFPVYQKHRDQVVGMVSVKALWANAAFNLPTTLKNLLVPPLLVPEQSTAIQVLEQFKKSGRHAALVADEFGGVSGFVTLIDILEMVVGDLPDQMRKSQPEARKRDDGSWLVDATLPVGDLKDLLDVHELPGEDAAEFQTLGGFVVTHLGRIPVAGDVFDWESWRFEVLDMDRHRVDKVLIGRAPSPAGVQQASA